MSKGRVIIGRFPSSSESPLPLPPAAARQHLHNRHVEYRGYRRDDGGWDIEGELRDTKTYDMRVVGVLKGELRQMLRESEAA